MKNWLTSATKKRVIRELKRILHEHPRYRGDSENVQAKYSFEERPSRGIIVNGTSAERVRLSADNYMGRIQSFVMLTPMDNSPCTSLEWVTENLRLLETYSKDRSVFPSAPGAYVIVITKLPDDAHQTPGEFTVEPILTVIDEPVLVFSSSADQEAQLSNGDIYENSVRLWLDKRRTLVMGVDYAIDHATGAITFLKQTPSGSSVHADYRHKSPVTGPFQFHRETFNVDAIPGAVLAFGDRTELNDRMAIIVTDERVDTADVYGGKFEVNFELIAFTKDSDDREKLSDYMIAKILEMQNGLGFEGLELLDVSPGGESEEVYNEASEDYYYDSTISMTLRVDWEIYQPLPVVVQRAELTSREAEREHGYLEGSYPIDQLQSTTKSQVLGIPLVLGRELTYERTS